MPIIRTLCGDVGLTKQVSNEAFAEMQRAGAASLRHPCQLPFPISPHPILNASISSHVLPTCAFKLAGAGSAMYNNITRFNQQDSTDTSPTEIDELTLTFPCICIILNFSCVEFLFTVI